MKKLLLFLVVPLSLGAANLISTANGNWLDASTWGVAEAGASSVQTTRSASTNTTTSYVYSSAFTCTNLDVVDGLLLHTKQVSVTGTVSVTLSDDNGVTATREVTINATDIGTEQEWKFFKFGSTLACDGGSDYKVGVKGSSANNAAFYRDGTGGNWTRLLRTTATAAPGAADNLYIAGEWTAAATVAARTVTMNALQSSITDHGTLDIGNQGTLTYATTAATWFYLRLSGDLNIWGGGALNIGTTGTPMPSGSRGDLNLDCGSNVQYGLIVNSGGTFVMQGASMSFVKTFLAADASANATTLTTADSTGWGDNDKIAVATTTQTSGQTEQGQLNGAASGTTLTVDSFGGAGGGLANAHSGTSPTMAEIGNLTRNVSVFGASISLCTYVLVGNTAAVDWDYAELYWLGSATANKRGVDVQTTTGSFNASYSSFHDYFQSGNSYGLYVSGSAASNVTLASVIVYNTRLGALRIDATSGTWSVTDSLFMLTTANGWVVELYDVGGTFTGNTIAAGVQKGLNLGQAAAVTVFSNNTVHSSGSSFGLDLTAQLPYGTSLSGLTIWRNGAQGINIGDNQRFVTFSNVVLFGNGAANIRLSGNVNNLILDNVVASGDSTFATPYAVLVASAGSYPNLVLRSCDFGTETGIKVAHSTADIGLAADTTFASIVADNTKLASSTPIANLTLPGATASFQKYGQTAGDHRTWVANGTSYGVIQTDSVIYRTASPSERLTPTSAGVKLESGQKCRIVANGGTASFSVWVRESVVGDGTDYNGARLRLILKRNDAMGITSDTVLDTATVASEGAFEQISGTSGAVTDDGVLCAVVDGDGTGGGWWNVDDWQ